MFMVNILQQQKSQTWNYAKNAGVYVNFFLENFLDVTFLNMLN